MTHLMDIIGNVVTHILRTNYLLVLMKAFSAIAGTGFLWLIARQLLVLGENRFRRSRTVQIDALAFRSVRTIVFYLLLLFAGSYLIRLFQLRLIERSFWAILFFMLAFPVKSLVHFTIRYVKEKVVLNTETKVDDIVFDLLDRFSGVAILILAAVLALDIMGINVMPFIAGAGVAGIAIGFAAKDTLSNLIAGVLLIIDRPFEIGDRIEVWSAPKGSATWGDVIDIGIRATKIKTTDNIIIIIPNNEIMKRDIVNYTANSGRIRVRVNIGVAYDTDIDKARRAIIEVAKSAEWILTDPCPKVVVRNFGESSIDLQLRVWIKDARKRMDTISYVTDRVKAAFDGAGIEIPYPKRDITIIQKTVEQS